MVTKTQQIRNAKKNKEQTKIIIQPITQLTPQQQTSINNVKQTQIAFENEANILENRKKEIIKEINNAKKHQINQYILVNLEEK